MTSTPRGTAARRRTRSAGWIPNQHGAWFMVTIPPLVALALAPSWLGVATTFTWLCGYFAFFAATVWLRARRASRHLPPVLTYTALTAVAGIITVLIDAHQLRWVPVIAPLAAIAIWETYQRRPRSLLSGVVTVAASGLMVPVVAGASPKSWAMAAIFVGYFVGTVPYVKTMIRNRGQRSWLWGSIGFHVFLVGAAAWGTWVWPGSQLISPWVVVVAAIALAKAIIMPLLSVRGQRPLAPKYVGGIDALISIAVVWAAW